MELGTPHLGAYPGKDGELFGLILCSNVENHVAVFGVKPARVMQKQNLRLASIAVK